MSDLPPQSTKKIEVTGQVGVLGDHAHVEGGIHLHVPPSRLGAMLGRKERIVTLTPGQQRRNRENLLSNMKATWIDGYLHNAVHQSIFMELGLEYKREALSRPWDLTLQPTNQPIPPDKPIGAVFREHGRSLLILGEPASGKTITMLQLAKNLIAEAEQDGSCPIPVILNLSSWARERQPLPDWLAEEMFVAYQVSRPLTRAWIEANAFALLLDGLDEVDEACRDDCLAAINDFKAEHSADIVVCSRIADYEALSNRLNLSTAIRIQSLTSEQVDDYLSDFGSRLTGLRVVLKEDEGLQELAESPLMLSLMPLVYDGLDAEQPPTSIVFDDRRRDFLGTYVRRVLQHRPLPSDSTYDEPQALRWLTNLAQGITEHSQSIFYIEHLQPTWLPTDTSRLLYRLLTGLAIGLAIGLVGGLFGGLFGGLAFGLFGGLVIGLAFGLVGGVGCWLAFGRANHIILHEELHWSAPSAGVVREAVQEGLVWGVFGGLAIGLGGGLVIGLAFGLVGGLFGGLMFGLMFWLWGCLHARIQISQTPNRTRPNQGIRSTFRNSLRLCSLDALFAGSFMGLFMGLFGALLYGLFGGLVIGLALGLVIGLAFGLMFGLAKYGGGAAIKHYTLRLLLARRGILPFPFSDRRLVAYLDSMTDRILLRRVGGGLDVHTPVLAGVLCLLASRLSCGW